MPNSKTALNGYIGLVGTVLAALGAAYAGKTWGQALLAFGLALKGADSVGNLASQDRED